MSAASSREPRAASTSTPPRSPSHRPAPPTPSRASWTASPGSPAPLTTAATPRGPARRPRGSSAPAPSRSPSAPPPRWRSTSPPTPSRSVAGENVVTCDLEFMSVVVPWLEKCRAAEARAPGGPARGRADPRRRGHRPAGRRDPGSGAELRPVDERVSGSTSSASGGSAARREHPVRRRCHPAARRAAARRGRARGRLPRVRRPQVARARRPGSASPSRATASRSASGRPSPTRRPPCRRAGTGGRAGPIRPTTRSRPMRCADGAPASRSGSTTAPSAPAGLAAALDDLRRGRAGPHRGARDGARRPGGGRGARAGPRGGHAARAGPPVRPDRLPGRPVTQGRSRAARLPARARHRGVRPLHVRRSAGCGCPRTSTTTSRTWTASWRRSTPGSRRR